MKALILNGSPRKSGNTAYACGILSEALRGEYDVQIAETASMRIGGCLNCDACRENGGICIQQDDGCALAERIAEADLLVFATPVYWWGMSAQLKLAIDRMYAKGDAMTRKRKKTYVVAIGADPVDEEQYTLIGRQFALICEYLKWDFSGICTFSALEADALSKQAGAKDALCGMLKG
ncbi:MAG: flavodoxin family protein [Christensenellales bacterium]|jgi:multimeric flavodoxin WrbA